MVLQGACGWALCDPSRLERHVWRAGGQGEFVLKMMNFVLKMMQFVLNVISFALKQAAQLAKMVANKKAQQKQAIKSAGGAIYIGFSHLFDIFVTKFGIVWSILDCFATEFGLF